jgi:Flp pilus assembly protein TadG
MDKSGKMSHKLSFSANSGRRGNSLLEFSLLFPWLFFLVIGTFDFGFFAYALMATQGAAREAGIYCASSSSTASDSTTACGYALDQLRGMPNIGMGLTTCASAPLTVTSTLVSGASSPDGMNAASVVVTYVSPQLIPIPGIFPGQLTITRTVLMRTRS